MGMIKNRFSVVVVSLNCENSKSRNCGYGHLKHVAVEAAVVLDYYWDLHGGIPHRIP